jgi:hypothetical protein
MTENDRVRVCVLDLNEQGTYLVPHVLDLAESEFTQDEGGVTITTPGERTTYPWTTVIWIRRKT